MLPAQNLSYYKHFSRICALSSFALPRIPPSLPAHSVNLALFVASSFNRIYGIQFVWIGLMSNFDQRRVYQRYQYFHNKVMIGW